MSVLFDNDMKSGNVCSIVWQSWLQLSWQIFEAYIRDGSEQEIWFYAGLEVLLCFVFVFVFFFIFLIGIHSMQGWTATTWHGVIRKKNTKILTQTVNLFKKNVQLKDVY